MSSFTSLLIVSPLPSGKKWQIQEEFTYYIGSEDGKFRITIPAGFITDFASIPRPLRIFLPEWAKYNKSSPIHDWLYQNKMIETEAWSLPIGKPARACADQVFYEAMLVDFRDHKSGKLVALIEYWAVRIFGRFAWHENV